jgi:ABC-type lipoprotein export system ATPase subunit
MGGLDKADSGEIIINNKSSREFNGSEMDSYRNTYLGFIFQEYNILNDFTVRENIELALQLQHKKVNEGVVDNILEKVDLKGFGERKANELSGGQKQRVAIARALVKDPPKSFLVMNLQVHWTQILVNRSLIP